ncbi:MAG: pilus assembly protein PilP [Desulfobacterales bacterium]|nr:pilus assembly protein PilP [Desulfobacterales bacterium]
MRLRIPKGSSHSKTHILLLSAVLFFSFILISSETKPESTDSLPENIGKNIAIDESQKATSEKKEGIKEEEVKSGYNPTGKRDPFKPFISKLTVGKSKITGVRLTPLQRYNFSQLKLIGIIWRDDKNIAAAMVEDPEGKGYVLKKGTLIGENNGRVINILKDRVIIEEVYRNNSGKIKTRTASLKLHNAEEGETR